MEFRMLGPLEVEGAPPLIGSQLGGPKQRALLALLLLAAGKPVSGERIVEELWGENPPETASHAIQVYVSKLRPLVAAAGAEIIRRGTGYELALGDAQLDLNRFDELARSGRRLLQEDAAEAALAAFDEALSLWRGEPLSDIDGEGVAARIRSRLGEEQLTVIEDRLDAQIRLGSRIDVAELEQLVGEHPFRDRLRGGLMLALYRSGRQTDALEAYRDGVTRLREELGLEPGAELRTLEAAIIRRDAALEPKQTPQATARLPAPATPLVGRRVEVGAVTRAVRDARLVTLTGPGGIGKTRLAIETTADLAPSFPDGVWFVGLAALRDWELVESTIATAIELPDGIGLEEHLRERRLLLVLDNFEQILRAAEVISRLLEAAPGLKVLVTSRAPLRLYGEHELQVPPLDASEAAELFVQRVKATGRELGPEPAVDEICDRLDRLPLAIELVAARVRELDPAELVTSLDRRLDLASRGARNLPERQRTLRAAIDWSHDLLAPDERRVFASLGAFAGGFTRDAAATVCGAEPDTLAALVDGSLVRRGDGGRYGMLETIREFAVERLDAADEGGAIRRRHADHFAEVAEELAPALIGDDPEGAYRTLDAEHDNLRAALRFTGSAGLPELQLRLSVALSRFWYVRGHLAEGRAWFAEALQREADVPAQLRTRGLRGAAMLDWRQGDLQLASERATRALAASAEEGDENERVRALILLGCVAHARREPESAREWWEQSVTLARQLESEHLSVALNNLAALVWEQGDLAAATTLFEECLAAARTAGSTEYAAFALMGLGDVNVDLGNLEVGRAQLSEALALFAGLGFQEGVASCCVYLAVIPEQEGDLALAARLTGAAVGLRKLTGASPDWHERALMERLVARLRLALGEESYAEAAAAGEAAPGQIVEQVLEGSASTLSE